MLEKDEYTPRACIIEPLPDGKWELRWALGHNPDDRRSMKLDSKDAAIGIARSKGFEHYFDGPLGKKTNLF